MTRIPRNARLIYAAGFMPSARVTLAGVTRAVHLASVGFSVTAIGVLIGGGLTGSSAATVIVSLRGDAWGREARAHRARRAYRRWLCGAGGVHDRSGAGAAGLWSAC